MQAKHLDLVKMQIPIQQFWDGATNISNKLPGDTDTADLWSTPLSNILLNRNPRISHTQCWYRILHFSMRIYHKAKPWNECPEGGAIMILTVVVHAVVGTVVSSSSSNSNWQQSTSEEFSLRTDIWVST